MNAALVLSRCSGDQWHPRPFGLFLTALVPPVLPDAEGAHWAPAGPSCPSESSGRQASITRQPWMWSLGTVTLSTPSCHWT